MTAIELGAADYSRQRGLSQAAHPKHLNHPKYRGVWLDVAYAEIRSTNSAEEIIAAADRAVAEREQWRHDSYVAGEHGRATGADRTDAAGSRTTGGRPGTQARAEMGERQSLPQPAGARRDAGLKPYPSPDDVRLEQFTAVAGAVDITSPDAIEHAFYEYFKPVRDEVTGFYEARIGEVKSRELLRTQRYIAERGKTAFYASVDFANLGGLIRAMPDREHAREHFGAVAGILRGVFEQSGGVVVPMRTGGDEMGVIVVDVDAAAMGSAHIRTTQEVADYACLHELSEIPHPKHPSDPAYFGIGLHIGYVEILSNVDIEDIFDNADLRLDAAKKPMATPPPSTDSDAPDRPFCLRGDDSEASVPPVDNEVARSEPVEQPSAQPAGVRPGWRSRPADNRKGVVWQDPSATRNEDQLRIMDPGADPRYPNGYVRFYNEHGQPIDLNGKPGPKPATHIPRNPDGSYPLPTGW